MKCIGIFREVLHSPLRERDDYEIMRLTGECLTEEGLNVSLFEPGEFLAEENFFEKPALIFMMCEQESILKKIAKFEGEATCVINSTQSVLNTYRYRLIPLWKKDKVSQPQSELVPTTLEVKDFHAIDYPLWMKRGDVHNTQKGDVVLVQNGQELSVALKGLLERGVPQAALQKHIEGDLVKFYGIGSAPQLTWFKWFYHKGQNLRETPFDENKLKSIVESAAKSIGVEVFGGDAVISNDGNIFLIDMNAWPSFALFREEASKKIAQHLASRISKGEKGTVPLGTVPFSPPSHPL